MNLYLSFATSDFDQQSSLISYVRPDMALSSLFTEGSRAGRWLACQPNRREACPEISTLATTDNSSSQTSALQDSKPCLMPGLPSLASADSDPPCSGTWLVLVSAI